MNPNSNNNNNNESSTDDSSMASGGGSMASGGGSMASSEDNQPFIRLVEHPTARVVGLNGEEYTTLGFSYDDKGWTFNGKTFIPSEIDEIIGNKISEEKCDFTYIESWDKDDIPKDKDISGRLLTNIYGKFAMLDRNEKDQEIFDGTVLSDHPLHQALKPVEGLSIATLNVCMSAGCLISQSIPCHEIETGDENPESHKIKIKKFVSGLPMTQIVFDLAYMRTKSLFETLSTASIDIICIQEINSFAPAIFNTHAKQAGSSLVMFIIELEEFQYARPLGFIYDSSKCKISKEDLVIKTATSGSRGQYDGIVLIGFNYNGVWILNTHKKGNLNQNWEAAYSSLNNFAKTNDIVVGGDWNLVDVPSWLYEFRKQHGENLDIVTTSRNSDKRNIDHFFRSCYAGKKSDNLDIFPPVYDEKYEICFWNGRCYTPNCKKGHTEKYKHDEHGKSYKCCRHKICYTLNCNSYHGCDCQKRVAPQQCVVIGGGSFQPKADHVSDNSQFEHKTGGGSGKKGTNDSKPKKDICQKCFDAKRSHYFHKTEECGYIKCRYCDDQYSKDHICKNKSNERKK
jgi:hypothetical protein